MVPAAIVLLVLFVAVLAMMGMAFAGLARKERALDDRLHDVDTPTVLWIVPVGVDPAVVAGVLLASGFPTVLEDHTGTPWLRIECAADEHQAVRDVIEKVYLEEYAPSLHLPPVTFRDIA